MNKIQRVALLLAVFLSVAVFYAHQSGWFERTREQLPGAKVLTLRPKPPAFVEPVSTMKQALRNGDFAGLDARLSEQEQAANQDNRAEMSFLISLDDLGHATEDDLKLLEKWAEQGSHYAWLALSRSYRNRGTHVRGENFISKTDPERLRKFGELTQKSYDYAEKASKQHATCGAAYGLMIEALVGIGKRADFDALYARAREVSPNWFAPIHSYFYVLHPNWYGGPDERKYFVKDFVEQNPGHRAIGSVQSIEYSALATRANNDRKYGEAMILADLALQHSPLNSFAWKNKGRAYEGVQRAMDALAAYDKAIELYPFDYSTYRWRGLLRLTMGNPEGQNDLARAAFLGDDWALKQTMWNWLTGRTPGVAKDWASIPEFCERARHYGMPDGTFCLATVYYFGYGRDQDQKKGFELMRQAAEEGVADAMSDVGKIYWKGNAAAGVTPDKERALRYWRRAVVSGNDRALVELNQVKNDPDIIGLMEKLQRESEAQSGIPVLHAPGTKP